MPISVLKFGGTSLSESYKREAAVLNVKRELERKHQVIAVVSAMGRMGDPYATDTLLSLTDSRDLPSHQKSLLLSCGELISAAVFSAALHYEGVNSEILTGKQAGIKTRQTYNADISSVNIQVLLEALKYTDVIIVPGFQGEDDKGRTSTLGRGGSDTSACAIAASINAAVCRLYTDVAGIMSGDPRIVDHAAVVNRLSYDEAFHIAHQGAKIIHPKAVEWARKGRIPVWTGDLSGEGGTWIGSSEDSTDSIHSVTAVENLVQISVQAQDCDSIFRLLAEEGISIDLISIQPIEVKFTIQQEDYADLKMILNNQQIYFKSREHVSKIALIGSSIAGRPGVASSIVTLLTKNQISIWQTADSHLTFWILLDSDKSALAQQLLHQFFIKNELVTIQE
ncbi:aspartate kinase [Jeotgalibacillus haloalkalitolerans]|uniref:Aspartokinase n=1 Tax=Jeotgalibacillus haloalkalitolerans TaxID=3104292 RepID=A0ABU5KKI1_9BACL|nr:aspartate kinase [Jeotgalibacillus sp. HH7-29]MDZ5711774.1 aspartate kinase [Jeotgalibacillus sp. HH7-29]